MEFVGPACGNVDGSRDDHHGHGRRGRAKNGIMAFDDWTATGEHLTDKELHRL
jgi:hypothetical protein